jgi:hypothetical protein
MKNHLLIALTVLAFQTSAFSQAKKPEPAAGLGTAKPGETTKPAEAPAKKQDDAKSTRPLPMHSRVDEIDAAAKTFTQNTREGKKVKHVITNKTEIKQGRDSAKFDEIKVGDMVSGSRVKKNAEGTEYEVIKITKFSPKAKADEKK